MKMYRSTSTPTTPMQLLIPNSKNNSGYVTSDYEDGGMFFSVFKSYGGTDLKGAESASGSIIKIIDTANVECCYNPKITSKCMVKNLITGKTYRIINEPEDVEQRHMILKFKVQNIEGA